MKLAICLSGMPRTFAHTAPTLCRYFDQHQTDIYLHLWQGEVADAELKALQDAYHPVCILQTARPDADAGKAALSARFAERPNPFCFDMFYAIARGIDCVPRGEHTHIVRARYDTIFDGRCPDEVCDAPDNVLFVPDAYTPPKGCNDQFAIGTEKAMRTYAGMYDWLAKNVTSKEALPDALFKSNPTEFRPEQGLMTYLSQTHDVVQAPLQTLLLRDSDIGKTFDELPKDINQGCNVSYEAWKKRRDDQALTKQNCQQALMKPKGMM